MRHPAQLSESQAFSARRCAQSGAVLERKVRELRMVLCHCTRGCGMLCSEYYIPYHGENVSEIEQFAHAICDFTTIAETLAVCVLHLAVEQQRRATVAPRECCPKPVPFVFSQLTTMFSR